MEEDEGSARSEVPVIKGTQTESSAVEEGDVVQNKNPDMLQVSEVEAVQTDAAERLGERAAGQGEHPEEERED